MGYPVTLIQGVRRGTEVATAAKTAIDATGVLIDWQVVNAGADVLEQYDTPLPDYIFDAIQETKTVLKGPMTIPLDQNFQTVNREFREKLNLYANLRSAKSITGVKGSFQNVDLVIVRENTEDIYAGIEFERTSVEAADARSFLSKLSGKRIREDSALGIKSISVKGSGQIVEFAFNYARKNGRSKVTAIHKADFLTCTDGLFLEIAQEIAKEFPEIEFEDRVVDTVCMELMQKPNVYDVLVMPNFYGDLFSHLCAGMMGNFGAPSAHIGDKYAVFEVLDGSTSPDTMQENPTALILSGVLMLQHLGEQVAAQKLQTAVETVIAAQTQVISDVTPTGAAPISPQAMAQAIAQAMV